MERAEPSEPMSGSPRVSRQKWPYRRVITQSATLLPSKLFRPVSSSCLMYTLGTTRRRWCGSGRENGKVTPSLRPVWCSFLFLPPPPLFFPPLLGNSYQQPFQWQGMWSRWCQTDSPRNEIKRKGQKENRIDNRRILATSLDVKQSPSG